jgi:hypothetical protein
VLVTSSTSLKKNYKILEREANKLYTLGEASSIEFDLAKTELIHFFGDKQATTETNSINLPNNQLIQPSKVVKWLRIWFDNTLSFNQYILIRIN